MIVWLRPKGLSVLETTKEREKFLSSKIFFKIMREYSEEPKKTREIMAYYIIWG